MRVTGRVQVWLPKNSGYASEDATMVSTARRRAAVADGASEGVDVRRWANLLVTRYVNAPPPIGASAEGIYEWFRETIRIWNLSPPTVDPDDWRFQGVGATEAAFATFLGLQFRSEENEHDGRLEWEAIAVGDSCLVRVPSPKAILAGAQPEFFPYSASAAFTSTPDLVPSDLGRARRLAPTGEGWPVRVRRGFAEAGEVFLLGSDAISKWLYTLPWTDPEVWRRLPDLRKPNLEGLAHQLKDAGEIDHDDLTLVVLRVREDPRR
ncbi:hypothetical protein CcI156_13840 [Frankia sp. CcI156]|uniref:hypothetical protein n=2 Tax=Frankiaceae TaxID=74712 RepID=UPI0003CFB90E|nr:MULTISPECIES: hypothetical protein [unclassified Frankia]OAA23740.1 hypothetical protein AAY23_10515 [Frankia casuarinae]ONH25258.1 hypothetical protein CcI156_13840 [Frankia sp. CcI156]ETA01813.1 hypothetical protein CcI6DRAFT_02824 [Frankia sp. CcI6]KDA41301.1 hypothetical protein BMG523Draft_03889 [Frankia sp. BMG5.23]KFB02551.1 hypothetical protein ALLO2DRAFT_04701 [Frankia sp. Allo2]